MAFQNQPGCGCCGPVEPCGKICVSVRRFCFPQDPIDGVSVTVKKSGSTMGTCTAYASVLSLTLVNGGVDYTDNVNLPLEFTGTVGSGAAGLYDVVGGSITNVRLTAGGTGYTTAPTVSFPDAGPGSGANVAATVGSTCCVPITSAGTTGQYTVEVAASGYQDAVTSLGAVSCSGSSTTNVAVTMKPSLPSLSITAKSACGTELPFPGVLITVDGVGSATYDGTNPVVFHVPAGTYTVTWSKDRFNTETQSVAVSAPCGSDATATLTAASGYHCNGPCVDPLKDTVVMSDPVFGTCALTWMASGSSTPFGSPSSGWYGNSAGVDIAACPPTCPTDSPGAVAYYHLLGTDINTLVGLDPPNVNCWGPGPSYIGQANLRGDYVCPPSVLITGDIGSPPTHTDCNTPYGTLPVTLTITE